MTETQRAVRTVVTARPAHQTVILTSSRAAASALSLVWMIVVARQLGPDAVGGLTLGISLAMILSVLSEMGLPMIVADHVARRSDQCRSLVVAVIYRRMVVAALTGIPLLLMYRAGTDQTLAVPLLLTVSLVATAAHTTATAALRGLAQVIPDGANEVVSRVGVLAVGTLLLAAGHGVGWVAAVLALADVVSAVVLLRLLWRRTTPGPAFPSAVLHWQKVLALTAALLVGSLLLRLDVWLLSLFGDASDVAHYTVPARLAEGLLLPVGVAAALVVPLTSRAVDLAERGRLAMRYVARITAAVAALALVLALVARPVLELTFGSTYAGDADVLRLLCLAAVPSAVSVGLGPIVALHDRSAMFRCLATALAVDVLANLVLLPDHRGVGAAWSTVLSMSAAAVCMLRSTVRLPSERLRMDA